MRSIGESCWGEDSDYEAECLTPTWRASEPFRGSRLFKSQLTDYCLRVFVVKLLQHLRERLQIEGLGQV